LLPCSRQLGSYPELESELADIRQIATASSPEAIVLCIRDTRRFVETRLKDLQKVFGAKVATIRAELSKHVQKIILTPQGRTYIASGTWEVLGPWQHGWCRGPVLHGTAKG
jgi:hypothetical protein